MRQRLISHPHRRYRKNGPTARRSHSFKNFIVASDFEGAARSYEAAQQGAPDNIEFTFWRGVMLANFGKLDEAKVFLDRTYAALSENREPPVTFDDMDRASRLVDALLAEQSRF